MATGNEGEVNLGFQGSALSLNRLSAPDSKALNGTTAAHKGRSIDEGPYASIPEENAAGNGTALQFNDGYEMPVEMIRYLQDIQGRQATPTRQRDARPIRKQPRHLLDSWFSRVVLFLILTFSIATILLVILLILGKVGKESCESLCDVTGGPSLLAQTSDQSEAVMELSPLVETTGKLESDYNAMSREAKSNEVRLDELKRTLNTDQNETLTRLSELNATAQRSSLLFSALSQLNSSFMAQIDGKELDLSNAAEGLRAAIKTVNSTVGAMLRAKFEEPGPQGPRGVNGSRGPQGPMGAPGDMGPQGHNGTQGDRGPPGAMGETGPHGTNGTQGVSGIMGPKGDKGDNGSVGDQGPVGPQGVAGVGNFSWCEFQSTTNAGSSQVTDTSDFKMFWVQCSASLGAGAESNMNVALSGGFKQYTCDCLPSPVACTLQYWKCPVAAP